VAGDLSGIQDFIYTISSGGALRSVRARSFYLELLVQHVVYELLSVGGLNRSAVVYSGGGGFCLLLPSRLACEVDRLKRLVNDYLLAELKGRLYLGIAWLQCRPSDVAGADFGKLWRQLGLTLELDKSRKFADRLPTLLAAEMPKQLTADTECTICHRDDHAEVRVVGIGDDEMNVCPLCGTLWGLGADLTEFKYVLRSGQKPSGNALRLPGLSADAFYWVADEPAEADFCWEKNPTEPRPRCWPLAVADHVAKDGSDIADFQKLAELAEGDKKVACLRMDVDNLGRVVEQEAGKGIVRLSALSAAVTRFFTSGVVQACRGDIPAQLRIRGKRAGPRDVHVIYSGGDDLMILGAWSDALELACDIANLFHQFTGNPDVTVSAGVFVADPHFPFYQMASMAGGALDQAKENERSCKSACPAYREDCGFRSSGPRCRRKDSCLLFYDPAREHRRREHPTGQPGEVWTSLHWNEMTEHVIGPALMMQGMFAEVGDETFSHAFLYRLLHAADLWADENYLVLPLALRAINAMESRALSDESRRHLASLRELVGNAEKMKALRIALTWLELLNR
jgi:CRISPR-associated protein Csm1